MPTADIFVPVLVVVILVFAIARQLLPQRVRGLRFLIMPILAAYEAYHSLPHPTVPLRDVIECGVVILVAILAGIIQAWSVRVFYKGVDLYTQGNLLTLAAWFGLAIVRTLIGVAFDGTTYFSTMSSHMWILWAGVAVAFGTRSAVLYMRHPEIRDQITRERFARAARRVDR